jgi:hypothetical protein
MKHGKPFWIARDDVERDGDYVASDHRMRRGAHNYSKFWMRRGEIFPAGTGDDSADWAGRFPALRPGQQMRVRIVEVSDAE